jgi:hypothetical protein
LKKIQQERKFFFFDQKKKNANFLSLGLLKGPKLQEKPSALKGEHPALQKDVVTS